MSATADRLHKALDRAEAAPDGGIDEVERLLIKRYNFEPVTSDHLERIARLAHQGHGDQFRFDLCGHEVCGELTRLMDVTP